MLVSSSKLAQKRCSSSAHYSGFPGFRLARVLPAPCAQSLCVTVSTCKMSVTRCAALRGFSTRSQHTATSLNWGVDAVSTRVSSRGCGHDSTTDTPHCATGECRRQCKLEAAAPSRRRRRPGHEQQVTKQAVSNKRSPRVDTWIDLTVLSPRSSCACRDRDLTPHAPGTTSFEVLLPSPRSMSRKCHGRCFLLCNLVAPAACTG